jgi:hypothetical protein
MTETICKLTAKNYALNFAFKAHLVLCDEENFITEVFCLPKWFDAEKFEK